MVYVALLRGINVGGNNKVEMPRLKKLFESLGYSQVATYINSGNVIFSDSTTDAVKLADIIEQAIESEFGFPVKVVVVKQEIIDHVTSQVPTDWVNDGATQKCDALFLWPDIDSPEVLQKLTLKPGIDEALYFPGAVVWRVMRVNINKSGMRNIFGTEVYKKSTARNINTVRKLAAMMDGQKEKQPTAS